MAEVEQPNATAGSGGGPGDRRQRFALMLGPVGLLPLGLLVGLAVTQGFDVAAFGVLAPEIRHTFHLGNTGIDTVTALTSAVPVMCSVFLGYFGDRGSRVRLTVVGASVWGVAAILTGLAPVLAILVAARLFGGVGLLATQTIYPSLLADFYPPEGLAQIFTVYLIGSTALGLIGSPLAGGLGSVVGWRPTFVVLAIPTFVCAASVARLLKEPARRSALAGDGASGSVDGEGHGEGVGPEAASLEAAIVPGVSSGGHFDGTIRDGFRAVRSIRTLRRGWGAAFLFGAGTIPLATLVSNFFHDVYHIGAAERGDLAAVLGLFGLSGIVTGGLVARRLIAQGRLERFPIFSGLAVIEFGVFTLVMARVHSLDASLAAASLLAIGAVGFLPAYITFVALIAPPKLRSQAYAWSLFFYALGAICLSSVIGAVADAHGQRTAMSLLALLVMVGGLIGLSASWLVKGDLERLAAEGDR
jgi:MFS family permease